MVFRATNGYTEYNFNRQSKGGEMATIDEQFVMYIVQGVVENPDDVRIDRTEDDKGILLSLTVHPDDLGRIIGKKGQTAQALRNLLRALGMKNDAHYHLKIVDTDKEESVDADVVENTTDENAEDVETTTEETVEKSSKLADKTRAELADLDDLDI
jgi:predicted RNA-binding protein YlqC (UPF0109 family)